MDWLERTAKLRQWTRSGTRAPHKPLLLLYAHPLVGPQPGTPAVADGRRAWHTAQVFQGSPCPDGGRGPARP